MRNNSFSIFLSQIILILSHFFPYNNIYLTTTFLPFTMYRPFVG